MPTRAHAQRTATLSGAKSIAPVEAVREVGDTVAIAIDKSLERRPYTTLLLAVGLGFVLGAMWAR
jgi:ElaB/YqjD/DUF883 family membrane-anchored ribosome-binding protein